MTNATSKQVAEILNNSELMMAIDDQQDKDTAAGLDAMSDVELFDFIADKTVVLRDTQMMIAGASRLLQQRHSAI